ncbi:MAG: hypothetical protein MJ246_03535 [Clostridia bacterium]|nr:hypothetical protein [Clostridia bacterium]
MLLATNQYSDCLVGGESIIGKGSDEVASLNADSTITLDLFELSDVQYLKFSEASMNGLDLNDVTGVTMGYKLVQIGDEYYNVFFAIPDSTEGEAE